jgi:lactose/L-arabinose transport system ATP-binding protein
VKRGAGALLAELSEALGGVNYPHLVAPTGERIIVEERGDERASEGETVALQIEPRRVMVFDAETEVRLR